MPFDTILHLLRCPVCGACLGRRSQALQCVNGDCAMQFPIVDGIPILLNERRSIFTIDEFVRKNETYFKSSQRTVQRVERLIPTTSANLTAKRNYRYLRSLLRGRDGRPIVLVIGGGVEGAGFDVLLRTPDLDVVETDVALGPRTGLVCDAHDLPFAAETFDCVVAQAVLEHVLDPRRCVDEIYRVLKRDGLVYAETPFMQQVHGGRYDFTRFTPLGHRRLFRHFEELRAGASSGPGQTLAWAVQYFCLGFAQGRTSRLVCNAAGRLLGFPWKYADRYLITREAALDGASGVYFIGRKSQKTLPDRDLVNLYRGGEYLAR